VVEAWVVAELPSLFVSEHGFFLEPYPTRCFRGAWRVLSDNQAARWSASIQDCFQHPCQQQLLYGFWIKFLNCFHAVVSPRSISVAAQKLTGSFQMAILGSKMQRRLLHAVFGVFVC
jgi:hypothetical protein